MERNFKSYGHDVSDTLKQPYDLNSIMHYQNKAFTKNGGDTIISRDRPEVKLGAGQEKLSRIDHNQLNQLYRCNVRLQRKLGYYSKFSLLHKEMIYSAALFLMQLYFNSLLVYIIELSLQIVIFVMTVYFLRL